MWIIVHYIMVSVKRGSTLDYTKNELNPYTKARPLNSHSATVRPTVSALISRSHSGGLISHGLLSMSTTDLLSHTT